MRWSIMFLRRPSKGLFGGRGHDPQMAANNRYQGW